jgi:hypothetical protein
VLLLNSYRKTTSSTICMYFLVTHDAQHLGFVLFPTLPLFRGIPDTMCCRAEGGYPKHVNEFFFVVIVLTISMMLRRSLCFVLVACLRFFPSLDHYFSVTLILPQNHHCHHHQRLSVSVPPNTLSLSVTLSLIVAATGTILSRPL